MSSWALIDSKRLFAAADALLEAVQRHTSVLTLLVETPGEGPPSPVLVFTPRELEEAAAMLKRMGYLDGDDEER